MQLSTTHKRSVETSTETQEVDHMRKIRDKAYLLPILGAVLIAAWPFAVQSAAPTCQWGGCSGIDCDGGQYYCAFVWCCDDVPCVDGEQYEFNCNQSWSW